MKEFPKALYINEEMFIVNSKDEEESVRKEQESKKDESGKNNSKGASKKSK